MKMEELNQEQINFTWHDRLAFCLALYKLILPQLLLMFGIILVVTWLLFTFWLI